MNYIKKVEESEEKLMAIFFDEAKPLKLYNGSFYYPIDLKDRFHNSIVYLMTPNIESSIN